MTVKRTAALGFIFVTILLDVIGIGIIIPVIPKLIEELTGSGLSEASKYGGWLVFSFAIMQFLFAPAMGSLSDKFGRRPILLFALLGLGLDYLLQAYAPTVAWLFIGRLLAGITGASFTTATAYIADISTPEKRTQNFGLAGAAFGVGFIIGPVIGGIFAQWGSRVPFLVAAGLTFFNLLYGYFVLPESLAKENRREFDLKRANPLVSLVMLKRYPVVSGLVSSLFLIFVAGQAVQSNWAYYTMLKFSWNEAWVGYSLGFVGLLVAIVQGGLIRVVIPKLGQNNALYFGLLLNCIGLALFSIANEGWMMFVILIPYALGGIAGPAIQGIISNQVPANEQGELQGAMASIMSASAIIGPLLMNNLFAYFSQKTALIYFPGMPFLVASILVLASLFLSRSSNKKNQVSR